MWLYRGEAGGFPLWCLEDVPQILEPLIGYLGSKWYLLGEWFQSILIGRGLRGAVGLFFLVVVMVDGLHQRILIGVWYFDFA